MWCSRSSEAGGCAAAGPGRSIKKTGRLEAGPSITFELLRCRTLREPYSYTAKARTGSPVASSMCAQVTKMMAPVAGS